MRGNLRFIVFDSDYYVRENIGYVEGVNKVSVKSILKECVKLFRLKKLVVEYGFRVESMNDDMVEVLSEWYVDRYLEVSRVSKKLNSKEMEKKFSDGFNWMGNMNKVEKVEKEKDVCSRCGKVFYLEDGEYVVVGGRDWFYCRGCIKICERGEGF